MTKYAQVMERLTVTPEMEARLLARVGRTGSPRKVLPLVGGVLAASVVVALAAVLALRGFRWEGESLPVRSPSPGPAVSAAPAPSGEPSGSLPVVVVSPSPTGAPAPVPPATPPARATLTPAPVATPPAESVGSVVSEEPSESPTPAPPAESATPAPEPTPEATAAPPPESSAGEPIEPGEEATGFNTLEELAEAAGFPMGDLTPALGEVYGTWYELTAEGDARVNVECAQGMATLLKSTVPRVVMGRYDELMTGEREGFLVRSGEQYCGAGWEWEGYAYALTLSWPVEKEELLEMIRLAEES